MNEEEYYKRHARIDLAEKEEIGLEVKELKQTKHNIEKRILELESTYRLLRLHLEAEWIKSPEYKRLKEKREARKLLLLEKEERETAEIVAHFNKTKMPSWEEIHAIARGEEE